MSNISITRPYIMSCRIINILLDGKNWHMATSNATIYFIYQNWLIDENRVLSIQSRSADDIEVVEYDIDLADEANVRSFSAFSDNVAIEKSGHLRAINDRNIVISLLGSGKFSNQKIVVNTDGIFCLEKIADASDNLDEQS